VRGGYREEDGGKYGSKRARGGEGRKQTEDEDKNKQMERTGGPGRGFTYSANAIDYNL
jgi:hypothetical protein